MRTTVEIVEILENYLKEKKLSLRQFSALVDIPHSTILTWKKKNTLPSIEFMSKIAAFMNVSLDWLVNGELSFGEENTLDNLYSRISILYRIEIVLRQNNHERECNLESLLNKYLDDVVNYEVLINWANGKSNMPDDILPKIAKKLKVELQWLLTKDEYNQQNFDAWIYGLAKAHSDILKGYDCLDEEDQMFIDHYIASRLEVRKLKREVALNKNDNL